MRECVVLAGGHDACCEVEGTGELWCCCTDLHKVARLPVHVSLHRRLQGLVGIEASSDRGREK